MSQEYERIWECIMGLVAARVSDDTLQRWFSSITVDSLTDNEIVLRAPNQIYQFWIETNYLNILSESIEAVLDGRRDLRFSFLENGEVPMSLVGSSEPSSPNATVSRSRSRKKKKSKDELAADAGLNHRYVFDSFVVGATNEFAHAACRAAAGKPGKTYNPLFIYGGAGLGKTHLMQSIGHQILADKPKSKVVYITSERFTNEFIDAIGKGSLAQFRQRYREADILLIDDIQFFGGKERSQEEFFHTFNTLCDTNNKQIVMTSDCPASEIRSLEKRLVSRFEWGMTAELVAPDTETRIAILHKKTQEWRVKIDSGIIEFLAHRIRNNVRRLEGALMRIASFRSLNEGELSLACVENLLKDILQEEARKNVSIPEIQKRVAEFFDMRLSDITSRKRPANIVLARQVAMYLAREVTHASYQEIGEAFHRDHGTVMHACRKIETAMVSTDGLRNKVNLLGDRLRR